MFISRYIGSALLLLFLFSKVAGAADIVSEKEALFCTEYQLHRELNVYKDPTLFLVNLSEILEDPIRGWRKLMLQNPFLTSLQGRVSLMLLGKEREFRNFGQIAALYEAADRRFRAPKGPRKQMIKILPVQVCGDAGYAGTLGFVIEADLIEAQRETFDYVGRPPSVRTVQPSQLK